MPRGDRETHVRGRPTRGGPMPLRQLHGHQPLSRRDDADQRRDRLLEVLRLHNLRARVVVIDTTVNKAVDRSRDDEVDPRGGGESGSPRGDGGQR